MFLMNDEKNKIRSINFEFILDTEFEEYYEKLVDDEIIFHRKPTNSKIYIDCSSISEKIIRKIKSEKLGDETADKKTFHVNLKELKREIPNFPYDKFYNIKDNANAERHVNKSFTKTVAEIFIDFHECLRWYFKFENIPLDKKYDIKFIIPNYEIKSVDEERYKKIINEYDKELEKLKKEYEKMRKENKELKEDIKNKNNTILEQNEKIKNLQIKINETRKDNDINEIEKKKLEKEIAKLKSELRESKNDTDNLKELLDNNSIEITEEQTEKIENLKLKIEKGLEHINTGINETSDKILGLKQLLVQEDDEIKYSKYPMFYKSFINLKTEDARRMYVMLDKLNMASLLITTVKNKLSKSNVDEMQKFINNESDKLKTFNNEEMKMKLYYKLMKICDIRSGYLAEGKSFKDNLDKFIEFSYRILENKKDFKIYENKLEAINAYYINLLC